MFCFILFGFGFAPMAFVSFFLFNEFGPLGIMDNTSELKMNNTTSEFLVARKTMSQLFVKLIFSLSLRISQLSMIKVVFQETKLFWLFFTIHDSSSSSRRLVSLIFLVD